MKAICTIFLIIILFVLNYKLANAQNVDIGSLETRILRILDDHHVPGAGVAVTSKDSIVSINTLGLTNVQNSIPVTNNTLFTIGSISKTFLSTAAMIAQEKGMLDTNAPIKELVPSLKFRNKWSDTDPVRFVHLLEHTSGFDEAHFNLFAHADSSTPFEDVLKLSKSSLETRWKPGKYFEYNTLGYILAAHIIEESVGMPYEEFVIKNILVPLDIDRASYFPQDSTIQHFSKGYTGDEFEEVPFPDIPQWPAGSLTMTTNNMASFVSMLLNSGSFKNKTILRPVTLKQLESPETSLRAEAGIDFGYAKGLQAKFENGHLFYGHSGRFGGFLSEFGYSRELNFGYVILLNNADGSKAIKKIKSVLLSSLDELNNEQIEQNPQVAGPQLVEITGGYQPITSVPQLGKIGYFIYRLIDMPIVEEENGKLNQSTMVGDQQALLHVKDLMFKSSGEPIASSAFVKDSYGKWLWLTNEASYKKIPLWWGYMQFYVAVICIFLIITGFVSLLIWMPVSWIRKKRKNLQLQLFPFLALLSFTGMIISIVLLYDPEKMFSPGSILFFIFGWLFFAFSFLALIKVVITIYKEEKLNSWIKYHTLMITLACCLSASYLLYWDIIGLMLWDY